MNVDIEHVSIGLNRDNFIHDILEAEFNGSFRDCAEALGIRTNYLRDIVMSTNREAGTKTLTCIYRYCIKTGKAPEPYIFVRK